MKLGKRLSIVAEMVGNCGRMADIGSDHALLPVWLLQEGKIHSAVAGELGDGPFGRAKQAAEDSGQSARLQVRQGNGLEVLRPGEVDTVVIAGMGGDLIAEILRNDLEKTQSFARYILQPMKHEAVLRKWLSEQRWPILREQLIWENGKYYVALEMRPCVQEAAFLNDLEILLGPKLLLSEEPFVVNWLRYMQEKYEQIAQKVSASRSANDAEKEQWRHRADELRCILEKK